MICYQDNARSVRCVPYKFDCSTKIECQNTDVVNTVMPLKTVWTRQ